MHYRKETTEAKLEGKWYPHPYINMGSVVNLCLKLLRELSLSLVLLDVFISLK